MIISDIQCYSYSMPLVKPLVIAGEELMEREFTQLVITGSDGEEGVGDLCPLPGFSSESYEQADLQLLALCKSLKGEAVPVSLDELALFSHNNLQECFPSVRNAVELALYDCICRLSKRDSYRVSLNGVIIADAADNISGVEELLADGYSSIKVKVGRQSIEDDIAFVKGVLNILDGKARLRLDANRSWSLDEAVRFGKAVACDAVEYIEEPVAERCNQVKLHEQTGIAVALDETLLEFQTSDIGCFVEQSETLECGALHRFGINVSQFDLHDVSAFVIKPLLVGGIVKTIELVRFALDNGITPVLSCCFESDSAVRAYAILADEMGLCDIPQGLDTWKWYEAQDRVFRVSNGVLEVFRC